MECLRGSSGCLSVGVGGAERRVPQAMLETWESTQGAQGTTHTHEMSLG